MGRTAMPSVLASSGHPYVSSSDIGYKDKDYRPRQLATQEIHEYVRDFATAASNAVHKAGFDGIEVHGAYGCLVDQFLQDVSNQRNDEYEGSVENRTRFVLEVLEAITRVIGAERTAIRLGPWLTMRGAPINERRFDD